MLSRVTKEPGVLSQRCTTPAFGQGSYDVLMEVSDPKPSVGRIVCGTHHMWSGPREDHILLDVRSYGISRCSPGQVGMRRTSHGLNCDHLSFWLSHTSSVDKTSCLCPSCLSFVSACACWCAGVCVWWCVRLCCICVWKVPVLDEAPRILTRVAVRRLRYDGSRVAFFHVVLPTRSQYRNSRSLYFPSTPPTHHNPGHAMHNK